MQHRQRFSLILFFFSAFFIHARKVSLPVNGLMIADDNTVDTSLEFEEKWFWESKTSEYNHKIARIACLLSEISYVSVEKEPEANEMIRSYRALGFKDENIEWNYMLDYSSPISGNNQAAYSIAYKDIQTPMGTKKLVFVVLRGTPLSANEWISNINVSDSTHKNTMSHEGFLNTEENVHKALMYFLLKNKISPDESYFLITGHSRGAALANLLGATLENEGLITGERLFVYTFAAPNVTQSESSSDSRYNFIWNIVNAEDIVPTVPPNRNEWKWRKFGQTKVLVNYWNCDPERYINDYIPRMNEYFKKFMKRDYAPFKIGPFIHIQIARMLTELYPSVESYYRNILGLRNIAESVFWKIFPASEQLQDSDFSYDNEGKEEVPLLTRIFLKSMDKNIDAGADYTMNAFSDMHACESYISWMLSLDEEEAFSDMESSQIIIKNSFDCAIYADDGRLLGRILDSTVELDTLRIPFAAMPFPNSVVLGFPQNQNLNIIIHKDSLIPTIVPYKIEHYDAAGMLIGESETKYFFPHSGMGLKFNSKGISSDTNSIAFEKLKWSQAKLLINQYGLRQNFKVKVQPEFSLSTNKIFSAGLRIGNQEIYGRVSGDFFKKKDTNLAGLTLTIGHQQSIFGRLMCEVEAGNSFFWPKSDTHKREFNVIPMGTISMSYKPRRRIQLFAGIRSDMHIDGFNDESFTDKIRRDFITEIHLGSKVDIYNSFQFGIRL